MAFWNKRLRVEGFRVQGSGSTNVVARCEHEQWKFTPCTQGLGWWLMIMEGGGGGG